jgi:DNA-directed RNA polymerase specialized sigma24 family protein
MKAAHKSKNMTLADLREFPNADEEKQNEIKAYIDGIRDPQTRLMFELHFLRGLSYRQTAKMIGSGITRYCVYRRILRHTRNH